MNLTVRCWNSHALRILVATLGKIPRFLAFFLEAGSSSSQPSVPSPLPTLALLASPAKEGSNKNSKLKFAYTFVKKQAAAAIQTIKKRRELSKTTEGMVRCRGAINSAGLSSIISPSCSVHPRRNSVGKEEVSLPLSLPRCLSWEKGGSRERNLAAGEKSEKLTARVTLTQPLSPPAHAG